MSKTISLIDEEILKLENKLTQLNGDKALLNSRINTINDNISDIQTEIDILNKDKDKAKITDAELEEIKSGRAK